MESDLLIQLKTPSVSSQVFVGKGILYNNRLLDLFKEDKNKLVVIADEAVERLYAAPLAEKLQAELIVIPSGETKKSEKMAFFLIDRLVAMKAGRDTLLIGMGGGVTTDLTGFAASIYLRGVPLVLIPTTLLGAVDAAIGGKTAINTQQRKNLIGTTYYPKAIFIDLNTLDTLSENELFNGLAEIMKMGLISDVSLLDLANEGPKNPNLIVQAIKAKIAIVQQDPTELGIRRILNFGHTIGHALESVSHYEMSHGEAVALGCVVESHLSVCLGYLSQKDFDRILELYSRFPLALPSKYDRNKMIEAMSSDKKRKQGEVRFVLLETLGKASSFDGTYCRPVSLKELSSTFNWMEEEYACKSLL